MRVAVLLPSRDTEFVDSILSLHQMLSYTKIETTLLNMKSALISKSRRMLVEEALQDHSVTHLLFIDSDMMVPKDTIEQLIMHDLPVVAANCAFRSEPIRWTARTRDFGKDDMVPTTAETEGIQKVWRVGTAVMLIKREVFEQIEKPWFTIGFNNHTQTELGEDFWFCQQCEKESIPIHIDHDISKEVFHIGKKLYGFVE